MLEAVEQELTHGDEGSIERTVQGKKDDWIAHFEAFYWPNALASEKDRNAMTKIRAPLELSFQMGDGNFRFLLHQVPKGLETPFRT